LRRRIKTVVASFFITEEKGGFFLNAFQGKTSKESTRKKIVDHRRGKSTPSPEQEGLEEERTPPFLGNLRSLRKRETQGFFLLKRSQRHVSDGGHILLGKRGGRESWS